MSKVSSNTHRFELAYSKKAHEQFSKKCAKMKISVNERLRQLIAADLGKKSVGRA